MATSANITTIQVELAVRKRLQALGMKGETYNDIIKKLLRTAAYADFMDDGKPPGSRRRAR